MDKLRVTQTDLDYNLFTFATVAFSSYPHQLVEYINEAAN